MIWHHSVLNTQKWHHVAYRQIRCKYCSPITIRRVSVTAEWTVFNTNAFLRHSVSVTVKYRMIYQMIEEFFLYKRITYVQNPIYWKILYLQVWLTCETHYKIFGFYVYSTNVLCVSAPFVMKHVQTVVQVNPQLVGVCAHHSVVWSKKFFSIISSERTAMTEKDFVYSRTQKFFSRFVFISRDFQLNSLRILK